MQSVYVFVNGFIAIGVLAWRSRPVDAREPQSICVSIARAPTPYLLFFSPLARSSRRSVLYESNGQEFAKLLFSERFSKSNALTAQRKIALLSAMLSEAVVERKFRPELLPR